MKAVLFDFNGTMIFDDKLHETAWRRFCDAKTGRTVSDQEFSRHIHGKTSEDILKYLLGREMSPAEVIELEEEKEQIYRQLCLESSEFCLVEGLEKFLNQLKADGTTITIATSSAVNNVKFFFEHLGLSEWFDFDKTVYNDGRMSGKPAPDIYLKAARTIGVDIQDCTVFEDSRAGIESAFNAGAGSIICVGNKIDEDTLKKYNVSACIQNYNNISDII